MWCRHCKQDVAAARPVSESPKCPRCQHLLAAAALGESIVGVADHGVPLDAFDASGETAATATASQMIESVDRAALRRLQRKLQPTFRFDAPVLGVPHEEPSVGLAPFDGAPAILNRPPAPRRASRGPQPSAWGVSLLLAAGGVAVTAGFALLVVANMMLHAAAWRWGFAIATGGEALIVAGLAGMAIRLWRNSRRLNSQLELIDHRLDVVQSTLVAPVASRPRLRADIFAAPGSARG